MPEIGEINDARRRACAVGRAARRSGAVTTPGLERFGIILATTSQMDLAAGIRLGPCEIAGLIGRGGMGEVYRGTPRATATSLDVTSLDLTTRSTAAGDARQVEPLLRSATPSTNGEISSDGRWFAYQSNESGQFQVYVRPFPNVDDGRVQISSDGGARPMWARNGRELFYLDGSDQRTAAGATITEVMNWFEELKTRVPAKAVTHTSP
jgi:hypothetical protein